METYFQHSWKHGQQVVQVHGDGYKDLMEEGDTYGALGVLFNGGKWYLQCVGCAVGSFVGGISSKCGIGKMDGLFVWVEK